MVDPVGEGEGGNGGGDGDGDGRSPCCRVRAGGPGGGGSRMPCRPAPGPGARGAALIPGRGTRIGSRAGLRLFVLAQPAAYR